MDRSGLHLWLVLWKAYESVRAHADRDIRGLGVGFSDFAVLELLLHKGPTPVNAIGQRVHLTSGSITAAVDRLARIVRPRSYMLAFFNSDDKMTTVPATTFRIQDSKNLILSQRGTRKQAQLFNNRSLEKLFSQFDSVKFFLTRENLREVIVKR